MILDQWPHPQTPMLNLSILPLLGDDAEVNAVASPVQLDVTLLKVMIRAQEIKPVRTPLADANAQTVLRA